MELTKGCSIDTSGVWFRYFMLFLQMLLGMYRCTDVPGEFVWQPGTLTQAATKGHWILLEDIDYAPLDVVCHLTDYSLISCV